MSQWTSKYAMLKDLSVAQGRRVPASLEPMLGNRPPTQNFVEETEEEFYRDYVGDGDFSSGPDVQLIQEMLSMVREIRHFSDDEKEKVVVISKLDPKSTEFVQKTVPNNNNVCKTKKKRRNVALTSLLEALVSDNRESTDAAVIITDTPEVEVLPVMFRRKKSVMFVNSHTDITSPPTVNNCVSYKPSTLANEYYSKFVEKSQLKELVQEDIWTRAERRMKEIDDKKKLDASSPSRDSKPSGVEFVALHDQRHLLTDECVVCDVLKKHGYDIKIEL